MDAAEFDLLLGRLLKLSRLTLDDGERGEFARKFKSLLDFVDAVNQSDFAAGVGRSAKSAGSLSYLDEMPLGDDEPAAFEFPPGFAHDYHAPLVVGGEDETEDGASGGSD